MSGGLAGLIVVFLLFTPFEEMLLSFVLAKTVFGLGWVESLLVGFIVGCVVLAIVEVWNEEG